MTSYKRKWGMANKHTFDCAPIGELVQRYLVKSKVSIDPFSGYKTWATYTNDLNPKTPAQYHLDSIDFLKMLLEQGVQADLGIFDPPYSPRQIKECYEGVGLTMTQEDGWRSCSWRAEKDLFVQLLGPNAIFIYCGWDTTGMGKRRGFEIIEGLIVNHGPNHNDTLVTVERRIQPLLL